MKITIRPSDTTASILERLWPGSVSKDPDSEWFIKCCTIIDEIHANLRDHVAPLFPDFACSLSVAVSGGGITLQFQYPGPRFDPTNQPDINIRPIENRGVGGLGLLIVSQLCDRMDYAHDKGLNTLTLYLKVTGEFRKI